MSRVTASTQRCLRSQLRTSFARVRFLAPICASPIKFWPRSIGRFRGHLEHYSYRSLSDHEKRMQNYAELMADVLYRKGKRVGLLKVWINPAWRFIRGYFLRLGILDGWRGLMFAIIETHYVHQKYLKLFLKQNGLPS